MFGGTLWAGGIGKLFTYPYATIFTFLKDEGTASRSRFGLQLFDLTMSLKSLVMAGFYLPLFYLADPSYHSSLILNSHQTDIFQEALKTIQSESATLRHDQLSLNSPAMPHHLYPKNLILQFQEQLVIESVMFVLLLRFQMRI